MALTYNIQQFAPSQPSGFGGAEAFLAGRDRRDAQVLYQDQMAAAKAKQDAIDREKSIALYEAQAAAQAKAQAEAEDKAYMSGLFMKAHENPTWENRSLLINEQARRNPAAAKEIRENFLQQDEATQKTVLRDSSNILTAFDTNPEIGISLLEELATAAENAGDAGDAKGYRDMAARAKAGPQGIMAVKDFYTRVIGAIDPEALKAVSEVGEETRKRAAEPTVQKQRLAQLGLTDAQINKTLAETRKFGIEADKMLADMEAAKKALPKGVELSADAEKLVNNSVMAAAKSNALVRQYNTLAADFEKGISQAGVGAKMSDQVAKLLGTEKEPTALRQEYLRMRNTAVLDMLPPGVASDKDIELALAAFPTETSSPANISGFLRGMAKLQAYEAAAESSKAEWIQQNGTLGTAKAPMQVGNREVPKGARFTEFIQEYIPNTSVVGGGGTAGATFGTVPAGERPIEIDEAGLRAYIEANSSAADKAEARGIKDFNKLKQVFSKSARLYGETLRTTEEADF